MDDRLRAVEIGFAQIEQRLSTLERLHLPSATHRPRLDAPAPGEIEPSSPPPGSNDERSLSDALQ